MAGYCLLILSSLTVSAQGNSVGCKVPINHKLWHDYVDKAQNAALKAGLVKGDNDDVVHFVNNALVHRVDALQCKIETDSMGDQRKVGYLRGLERILKTVTRDFQRRGTPTHFTEEISLKASAVFP